MMYQLVIERNAQKQLAKISTGNYDKIIEALKDLIHNPRPHGYKKLKGRPGYRIRVGDYPIIYAIEDNILIVYILDVDHRKDVYR
jgi:mRNA interferase RelE/StbE